MHFLTSSGCFVAFQVANLHLREKTKSSIPEIGIDFHSNLNDETTGRDSLFL